MAFAKIIKDKAYYKRFQVKNRRRRQGKTDYYARKRLVWQVKNKYGAPKYRLVVRFTNRDVIVSVISSDISGDRVVATAYGHELSRYGLKFGFNSWPATYATGLLVARRTNLSLGLPYLGSAESTEAYYNIADSLEDDSGKDVSSRRPFKAILDVGLRRTTTGCRLFAAVKGACDGGINVPHSTGRFPGTPAGKGEETDFSVVRKYIFGGHIAEYMTSLAEDDEERFKAQFSVASKEGITGENLEQLWADIHQKIRAETKDTILQKDLNKLGFFKTRSTPKDVNATYEKKYFKIRALTLHERKSAIKARLELRDARLAERKAELEALAKSNQAAEASDASESGSDSE